MIQRAAGVSFAGAVLTGGRSTRMGADKLFVDVDGRPLVRHAIGALVDAGASEVAVIGGPRPLLEDGSVSFVEDRYPGEGPLGAIVTALASSAGPLLAVISGDTAGVEGRDVAEVVERAVRSGADAAVARIDGTHQPLLACYRRATVHSCWEEAFGRGERSVMRALAMLEVEPVEMSGRALMDLDEPDDLRRYAALHDRSAQRGDQRW